MTFAGGTYEKTLSGVVLGDFSKSAGYKPLTVKNFYYVEFANENNTGKVGLTFAGNDPSVFGTINNVNAVTLADIAALTADDFSANAKFTFKANDLNDYYPCPTGLVPAEGWIASLAVIYDGNLTNNFTTYGGTAPKWIKIDLGKAYEIAYVSYIPKAGTSYNDSWIGNHSIQLSKNGTDNWVTLATTPVYDSSQNRVIEHVVAPVDTEKYQYVRIYRNSVNIACTEIDVYAYQGKPEVERVSLSGEGVTKASVGKVVFSTAMDRSTLTSENIVITDEWGDTIVPTVTSAYDKEFAFVADFKAGTEYKISVSSNVKSAYLLKNAILYNSFMKFPVPPKLTYLALESAYKLFMNFSWLFVFCIKSKLP